MRRTSISELLDAGADLATIQKMVGHKSVTTMASYDRRGDAAKRKAAELVSGCSPKRVLSLFGRLYGSSRTVGRLKA